MFSIIEMFISFFSGKVMLFFGISLIMKEKSNASALNAVPDSSVSYPRRDRLSSQTRARLLPETNASGPTFAKRHRHKIVDDKS